MRRITKKQAEEFVRSRANYFGSKEKFEDFKYDGIFAWCWPTLTYFKKGQPIAWYSLKNEKGRR
jgi:hypothetical protein